MKKFIAGIIALSLICGMTACGNSESPTSSENTTTTTTTTMATSEETTTTTTTAETTTTTEETTTTTELTSADTETTTEAVSNSITNTEEYVSAIGNEIEITDITKMAAEMIEAEEGTSFKFNDNKFEIYKYADGNPKLEEASAGSLTYEIEGFGEFTSSTVVNGNYIMLFNTEDEAVTNAFMSITF